MRTFVEYGLANAVAATLLALVALLVGLLVRRPAVRNSLWVLVLVRLLLPPVWTVTFTVPASDPAAEVPAVASATVDPTPGPTLEPRITDDSLAEDAETVIAPPSLTPTTPVAEKMEVVSAGRPPVSLFTVAAVIWIAGTTYVFLRSARRIGRFRRALRDAVPAPRAIQRQAEQLARAMGLHRCPEVVVVPGRMWPALWMPGLFARQAKLILPAELLARLDAGQRAAVVAHELAHLRRGDPWVRWLELVATGLYWWHPLLGWMRRQLREAEEECCDLRVVAALGERRDYATALVETAAFLGESGPVPALASGAGPVRHLQRRVTMIMRATWPAKLTRLGLAAVLGLGGLGLAFGPAVAQDRGSRDERKDNVDPAKERATPPRDEPRPRDAVRPEAPAREPGDRDAIEKARATVEKARKLAAEAMDQLRVAEEALARAEGRALPPRNNRDAFDRAPMERGGDRRPEVPAAPPGVRPGGPAPPAPPVGLRLPGAGGGAGELRELQMQIEELRRAMEEMRRELKRPGGDRKDPREDPRPKEEPKPRGREQERQNFSR